jgi:hypothetical protein
MTHLSRHPGRASMCGLPRRSGPVRAGMLQDQPHIRPVSVARVSAGSSGHAGVVTMTLEGSPPNRSSCCAGPGRWPTRLIRHSVLLTSMGFSSMLVARSP